jgi:hypothetical protein
MKALFAAPLLLIGGGAFTVPLGIGRIPSHRLRDVSISVEKDVILGVATGIAGLLTGIGVSYGFDAQTERMEQLGSEAVSEEVRRCCLCD